MGSAVPDRARALRAVELPTPPATQEADRLGTPSVAPDRALAAGTAGDRGGGQQLCRDRALARCGPAPVHDLTAAARRRSVRARSPAPAEHPRATPVQGGCPAEPVGAAGRSSHGLAPDQGGGLVWPEHAP